MSSRMLTERRFNGLQVLMFSALSVCAVLIFTHHDRIRTHVATQVDKWQVSSATEVASSAGPPKLQIIYKDFSDCPPRPQYDTVYKAHCWLECRPYKKCAKPASKDDLSNGRAQQFCFPDLHLVGIRKGGTTDFLKWFKDHPQSTYTQQGFWPSSRCPVEHFKKTPQKVPPVVGGHFFNDGPGNLVIHGKAARNSTHITIVTAMQMMGYMATPETKFYAQLRNPSDRVISYLFDWYHKGYIFKDMPLQSVNAGFIDGVISDYLKELKDCIAEFGDLVCFYLPTGRDGNMPSLIPHSIYIIPIEQALKFVPLNQLMFKTTEEYSKDQVGIVRFIHNDFFHLEFPEKGAGKEKFIQNRSKIKQPVWPSTLKMLDEFFAPYNVRLAKLLNDDKWLFKKNRG